MDVSSTGSRSSIPPGAPSGPAGASTAASSILAGRDVSSAPTDAVRRRTLEPSGEVPGTPVATTRLGGRSLVAVDNPAIEPTSSSNFHSVAKVIEIDERKLPGKIFKASHAEHGALKIIQREKSDSQISFKLELEPNEGVGLEVDIDMESSKSSRNYKGKSSVGYNYIDLDDLQGKSIGYVLHCAACNIAKQLQADLLVVDDVVEPAMHAMCEKADMTKLFDDSYSINPSLGEESFRDKSMAKGWRLDF